MSSNFHEKRSFSQREFSSNEINQLNNSKRERFHCYPPQTEVIDSKEQIKSLFSNNGLEMRRINNILIKGNINKTNEDMRRNNFDINKNNNFNTIDNIHQVNSQIIRRYKNESNNPQNNFKENNNLNLRKIDNNTINNSRINIHENNENYRKRLEKYLLKKNRSFNDLNENKTNDNCYNKIEQNKFDVEYIEYMYEKGERNESNNQKSDNDKEMVRSRSNHSFKYINQENIGRKKNDNRLKYQNRNYNYHTLEPELLGTYNNNSNNENIKINSEEDNNKNFRTLIIKNIAEIDINNENTTYYDNENKKNNNNLLKEIKEEQNEEKNSFNDADKKYSIKDKLIKIEENPVKDYKLANEYEKSKYNCTNFFNKNTSYEDYEFYRKERQKEKEKLLNKYLNNGIDRTIQEEKDQQNLNNNNNYNIETVKSQSMYDFNINNQIEKNLIKNNEKENKYNFLSNYSIKEEYNNNKIYETPLIDKYKKENLFSSRILYRLNNDYKNNIQKKILDQNLSKDKKQKKLFDEVDNKINKKNNLMNLKKVSNIGNAKNKNNNSFNKNKNKVKNNTVTQKGIEPGLKNRGKNNTLKNNFFKDIINIKNNNNINHNNYDNTAKSKNNNQINSINPINNKNSALSKKINNQVNLERKALSPNQIQNVKIKNKIFNRNVTNNSKKSCQNISNKNNIINNDLNNTKKRINNNIVNINVNNKKLNYKNNNYKEIVNNNSQIKDNINNLINLNTPIKNNFMKRIFFSNKKVNINKISNNDLESRNFSSQKIHDNKNNNNSRTFLIKNILFKNRYSIQEVIIKKKCANGLQNIGANSFMNAILQCFAHVEKLTKHLLQRKEEIKSKKSTNKLVSSYLEVLENIWENNRIKDYIPNNFIGIINSMNPLFKEKPWNYSKDFISFLLENMHNELNRAKNIEQKNEDNSNQNNFYNSLYSFTSFFKDNFKSVISDIFYGIYNSQTKCLDCNDITYDANYYNIIIIPLEEVRLFKRYTKNTVTIKDCVEYNQKSDYITGENQIFCNKCKAKTNSVKNTALIKGPNVLIINLNRERGHQFDVRLNFEEFIDIKQFVYYKNSNSEYQLTGVVTQFGPSGIYEHFVAFCKSFVDGNWYRYNDSIVTRSNFQEAKSTGVPYILFYSNIN